MDLDRERLILPDRELRLPSGVLGVLRTLRASSPAEAEHVLATRRGGRPYDRTRLSKLARTALVKGGLDDVTLRDLRLDYDLRVGGENQVLDLVRREGSVTRNQVMELLRVSKNTAYGRLRQMTARGRLTKVGTRYYLPRVGGAAGAAGAGDPGLSGGGGLCLPAGHRPAAADRPPAVLAHPAAAAGGAAASPGTGRNTPC